MPFYGDDINAVQQVDGAIYVLFARLCENLGVARNMQVRRMQTHDVLREGLVAITVQTEGGPQDAQCLRLDLLPLWLTSIQAGRVKPEVREKLLRYQREAAAVLWQAFKPQILVMDAGDELAPSTDAELVQLQQIVDMGRAITQMAQEQIEQRRRMDSAARLVRGLQTDVVDIQVRLGVLEDKVNPATYITDVQAAEVSGKVKALAEWLTKRDPSKNHYQGIYTELYRRFNVSGYKFLRHEQYEDVVTFLDAWRAAGESGA
ncbi:MAG: ORF6C domain-containing protein [Roseiflexaceae bacterium]|nr:ORF6C domain-containing protein [Roseiflexaceae bacterium]